MTSPETAAHVPTKKSILTPGGLFLLISLVVGVILCFAIPYGAGFDEETHMARIFEISGLDLLPNTTNQDRNRILVPNEFFEFSYQRRYFLTPAFDQFDPNKYFRVIDLKTKDPVQHRTTSVYPPVSFFPQALVAGIGWRLMDLPILPVTSLCRLAGLLVYVLGSYLAIRLLPVGKWVMAVLALSPMAMFQASTLNADSFTNVVSFLFIAVIIQYAVDGAGPIGWKQALILAGLCLGLGVAKQGAIAILPALVLLPWQRFTSKKSLALLAVGAGLAIFCAVGWSLWALPNSTFGEEGGNQSVSRAAGLVLANPLDFLSVFVRGVFSNIPRYFREWVGVYGHWLGLVPAAIYWFYPLALGAALLAEPRAPQFSGKRRGWAVAAFLAATGATALLFYVLFYRPGGPEIMGVQGRYLTPLTPLLFLPLAGLRVFPARLSRHAPAFAVVGVVLALALYGLGVWATYYSDCGKTWYSSEPCSQPIYKNIDKVNAPEIELNTQKSVSQTFTLVCGPLDSFEVYVKPVQTVESGSLRFTLLDGRGQALEESEMAASAIPLGKYLNFPIRSRVGKPGETFEVRLDTQNMAPRQGVLLGTSTDNFYAGGDLRVSGNLRRADLIFHYNCANPWVR